MPMSVRIAMFVVGATASTAAIASDFTGLAYFLLGIYAVGFILTYAIAWAIGTSIRYAGGRLLLHAVVLAFFLVPIVGHEFPLPAGLMLLTGTEPAKALACIAVGTLTLWVVAWWWHDTVKPDLDDLAEQARERSNKE
jgi:hypothetical protein